VIDRGVADADFDDDCSVFLEESVAVISGTLAVRVASVSTCTGRFGLLTGVVLLR
jgi:hypothetical protein